MPDRDALSVLLVVAPGAILASHGNLIALALHAFMPNVGYEFWESLQMPAVFTLTRKGNRWQVQE